MSPEVKLRLVEVEVERWLKDERPAGDRDAVHYDRLVRIVRSDPTGSAAQHTPVSS